MSTSLRVLGRIRLSKDADETGTSIERQRESIEQWSAMHGHLVVGWAVDSGVSGSIDPFDTPELGEWLTTRLPDWDALVAYRLDRLARRVIPLNRLFGFVQQHDKTIASVSESLDLSTWIGRLVANVIAGVAEGELEAIRERNLGSQKKVRQLGRWHGGEPPYGYKPEQRADGWYLVHQMDEIRVLRQEIVPRVLAHQSTNSIAVALTSAGIPTRKGRTWAGGVVRSMLKGRALLGQHEHTEHSAECSSKQRQGCRCVGKVVTGDDGMPLQRAEPILTLDEFTRVQEALKSRSVRNGIREPNPMGGVLFCYSCQSPMYHQSMIDRDYDYYRCSVACGALSIRTELVYASVEAGLLDQIGEVERQERVYVQGSDHRDALAAVNAALAACRREKDLGLYEGDDPGYFDRLQRLSDRRKELEALPSQPPGFEWRGLGETYGQAWERMDAVERRALMLDSGIRATVAGGLGNQSSFHLFVPDDLLERIRT